MKRILPILLVFSLLLSLSMPLTAVGTPTATATNAIAGLGETAEFVISFEDVPLLRSIGIEFTYDAEALTFAGGDWLIAGALVGDDVEKNKTAYSNNAEVDANKAIYRARFTVSETAAEADYTVECGFVVKNDEVDIPVSDCEAVITVSNSSYTAASEFTFKKDEVNKTVAITKYVGTATEVIIAPEYELEGEVYTVNAITGYSEKSGKTTYKYGAFMDNDTVTSVSIPDTVEVIGDSESEFYAFYGCTALTEYCIYGNPTIAEATLGMYYDEVAEADAPVAGVTIHAWSGDEEVASGAQDYAKANGIAFVGLEDFDYAGCQPTNNIKNAEADVFNIRFAGVIDALHYQKVGFEISAETFGKSWASESTTVYRSLKGTTPDGKAITAVTAAERGGEYLFALAITDVPTKTAIDFTVTPYVVNQLGAKVHGSTSTVNVAADGEVS